MAVWYMGHSRLHWQLTAAMHAQFTGSLTGQFHVALEQCMQCGDRPGQALMTGQILWQDRSGNNDRTERC